jgi:hypothetical protein
MAKIGKLLTAYTGGSSGNEIAENEGFMVNVDGTLAFTPRSSQAVEVLLPVLAGVVYPIDIKKHNITTGTVSITSLWVIRASEV